ncbi:inosose dehydratase [Actinoplanes octamycinicus]|uniref:Inosose dehydratase n=1 Tax=Actinoplanes octamycinicus TaxID=135948 RepID=A0A7W7GZ87_9ACTN|nr:sugar phosphate isomerase/epimerase [Actinoplanes octamycinicus]MBB4740967.1 inosose dehydratase [Actinoplanes octamycinicus]GIE55874.1 IolE protein [Actinoplanes octamycinicus]
MLRLGSCPDSWGVWYADDPAQTPWSRFLDELAEAGYRWLELGPYGYLPTDPARLADELAGRGLRCAAGTVGGVGGPHRDLPAVLAETRRVAELTRAAGGRDVVFVPVPGYRDDATGGYLEASTLSDTQWRDLLSHTDILGRMLAEEYGLSLRFHPHADYQVENQAQVERFLDGTDPRFVSLCLDVGHLAYRRADIIGLIQKYPSRIGYVHLKQMDPELALRAEAEDLAFAQAVRLGVSVAPPAGAPDMPAVLAALAALDTDLFCVVEQDMYPVDFDIPLPIAIHTRRYLEETGDFDT